MMKAPGTMLDGREVGLETARAATASSATRKRTMLPAKLVSLIRQKERKRGKHTGE